MKLNIKGPSELGGDLHNKRPKDDRIGGHMLVLIIVLAISYFFIGGAA